MRRLQEAVTGRALLVAARLVETRLRASLRDPAPFQEKALRRCLRAMEASPVRRRHGISLEESPAGLRRRGLRIEAPEFQELVHAPRFEPAHFSREGIRYFAVSSGTSSATPKLFPITFEYVRALERMQKLYFMHRLALVGRPEVSLGNSFMITALDMGASHAGIKVNPMSRILYDLFKDPPLSLMRIRHVGEFFDEVSLELRPGVRLEDFRDPRMHSLFGMPPFVLMIFERLRERFGLDSLRDVWPHLSFYGHSGFDVAPYADRLRAALGHDVFFFDGYAASEAAMGLQYEAGEPGMVFLPHDTFYEFVNQRTGDRLLLHELKEGERYEVLLTTPGGLLCYPLGDVVEIVGTDPVRFVVAGRLEESLRLTGEQVNVSQVEVALREAFAQEGARTAAFVVAPRADAMGYDVFVEVEVERDTAARANATWNPPRAGASAGTSAIGSGSTGAHAHAHAQATRFDARLRELNNIYALMRDSKLLAPPRVTTLRPGTLDRVMLRGKRFGQGKFRRLHSTRAEVASQLEELGRAAREAAIEAFP